ncbi:MAG TPA: TerB family tellurite resistance protein [Puia sp.]
MGLSKKVALISVLLCMAAMPGRSQSVGQLLEQLALDIQKLSELKTILQDMYHGYEVVDKGYTNIRDIVRGNFDLHKAFLDGLLAVSPTVRQYYRVAAIVDMDRALITEYQAAERSLNASGVFTVDELHYIHGLYASVSVRAGKYLDRLTMILADDALRMSDAERIQSIDVLYRDVVSDLGGLRRCNDALQVQMLQREREIQHINLLKSMYGNQP